MVCSLDQVSLNFLANRQHWLLSQVLRDRLTPPISPMDQDKAKLSYENTLLITAKIFNCLLNKNTCLLLCKIY